MALADLMRTLEQDAAGQVSAVLAIGEAAAAQVEADARRDRDELLTRAADEEHRLGQRAADARIAQAQHAARTRVLEARAAMLARVLDEVRAVLPEYLAVAGPALARAALAQAGTREGVVRCAASIMDQMPATLRVENSDVPGVIIELRNGTQIVATLDALLEREWPRLAASLLARLEAGS